MNCKKQFLALSFFALLPTTTYAGGIILYEMGTPEVGFAVAGWAARAQDAATVVTNPAGMTRLEGDQLMLGTQLLYTGMNYVPDSPDMGAESDTAIGWFPGTSVGYSHTIDDRLKVGFSVFNNIGSVLDYGDDWAGANYSQQAALVGMVFAPTVAYKLTDKWSVGAGVMFMYGYLKNQSAIPLTASGQMTIKDTQLGVGANLGLLYEFTEDTRIGLQYTSPIDVDFTDTPEITGTTETILRGNREIDLGVTMPQTAMLSLFHSFNKEWAFLADLGWQDWSSFGRIDTVVRKDGADRIVATIDQDFDDSYHVAIGAQYSPLSKYIFSAGVAFDSSNCDDDTRSFLNPVGDAWRFGLGMRYHLSEMTTLGFGYTYLWQGDLRVTKDDLLGNGKKITGELNDINYHFFAFNVNWKF